MFKVSDFLTVLGEESLQVQQEERMEIRGIIMRGQSGQDDIKEESCCMNPFGRKNLALKIQKLSAHKEWNNL